MPRKRSCPRFFNSPNPTAEDDAFAVMETVAAEETGCFLEPSLFKARLDSKCGSSGGCDMMTDLQIDFLLIGVRDYHYHCNIIIIL